MEGFVRNIFFGRERQPVRRVPKAALPAAKSKSKSRLRGPQRYMQSLERDGKPAQGEKKKVPSKATVRRSVDPEPRTYAAKYHMLQKEKGRNVAPPPAAAHEVGGISPYGGAKKLTWNGLESLNYRDIKGNEDFNPASLLLGTKEEEDDEETLRILNKLSAEAKPFPCAAALARRPDPATIAATKSVGPTRVYNVYLL